MIITPYTPKIQNSLPMRIAFIVEVFPKLSETFILNQLTGLIDDGHEVEIFPSRHILENKIHPKVKKYRLMQRTFPALPPPRNQWLARLKCIEYILRNTDKIEIISKIFSLKIPVVNKIDLFFRLIPFLERDPFDIIHCHFGTMGSIAVIGRNLGIFKGKLILSFYGYDATRHGLDSGYYRNIIPYFDVFISISNYLKERIIKLGFPQEKISIIPIGVNPEDFVKQKIPQKQQVIKLLTVVRLVEKKGVYYSIMAFSKIQSANRRLEYHIIGDGPLFKPLLELIDKLELQNKVFLHGALDQEEVKEYYQSAAIFVLPSITASDGDTEGQGLVLQEAQAMEIPIIATFHNGIPEGVVDCETGFLVPERDISALSEKMTVLIQDRDLGIKMGQRGRDLVLNSFDNRKLVRRISELYAGL